KGNHDVEYLCDDTFDFLPLTGSFLILIFIVSVIGNGLLLCILLCHENLKNITNIYVLNLTCSDLLFTLTIPFWAVYYLHHWVFGDFSCKFMTGAYFTGIYSSIILLTAMTVDRFITVVQCNCSSNRVKRKRFAAGACAATWVISIAASMSDVIKVNVGTDFNNHTTCEASFEGTNDNLGYYLTVSLLFFLPFAIIVFCYFAILKKVFQTSNRKTHRTVFVVLSIVAAFFICWGPYNIFLIIESVYTPKGCTAYERMYIVYHIFRILAFSHCCMNPLLYMLSQKLRKKSL
uniref:G-protein coupled receptors family 1 profile domain-containing protein n=1 Tax=Mastacembelus armatus TaxID=205130 RepID=A0A3Q3MG19_9TELE